LDDFTVDTTIEEFGFLECFFFTPHLARRGAGDFYSVQAIKEVGMFNTDSRGVKEEVWGG
jgi:hypothetical protein